jgi:copper transport protein
LILPRRSPRRLYQRVALAITLALTLVALLFSAASAHANLVRSDPTSGASLSTSPSKVQLWFSEELEPSFSSAVIYDANRKPVDLGDSHVAPDDQRSLIVGVKPGLPNGTYVIAWTTQSRQDGHIVRGAVPFGVGVSAATTDTASAAPAEGPVSGSPAEIVLRWFVLTSAGLVAGAFAFWLLQRSALKQRDSASSSDLMPGQRKLVFIGLLAFAIGNIGILLLQTSTAADVPLLGVIGAPLILALSATQYGEVWIFRMVAAGLIGFIFFARGHVGKRVASRFLDWAGLGVGLALLASLTATSHSASTDIETVIGYMPLGLANDWVHLTAYALWIGGLAQLAVLVPLRWTKIDASERMADLRSIVPRFSLLAGVSLAMVGASGVVEGLIHVGNLDNLLDSGYGQALLAKIIIIIPLAAVAAVNHYIIRPALARTNSTTPKVSADLTSDGQRLFAWTIRVEVVLIVAIVGIVGIMTSTSPAQQAAVAGSSGPLTLEAAAGDLRSTIGVSPAVPGPNNYTIDIRDATGQPATDVARATLRLTFLDSDLGVSEVTLTPAGAGRFEGQSSDLAVAGQWQVEAIFRRAGQDDVRATYQFAVTATGGQTLEAPPPQVSVLFFAGILVGFAGLLAFRRANQQRRRDLRRAAIVAICGVGLVGIGAFVSFQDFQQAQAQAASLELARFHPVTPESVANGALVFQQNCGRCHGLDARGNGPLAPTLNPRPSDLVVHVPMHPDVDLINWISNGFPGSAMPAFQTVLTEQQRWDVLNYLKSLSEPSSASAASAAIPAPPAGAATPIPPNAPATTSPSPANPLNAITPSSTLSPTALAVRSSTAGDSVHPVELVGAAGGTQSQRLVIDDLNATITVLPTIFQPATIDLELQNALGQPASDITRVDLQVAMDAMNHGARGIMPVTVSPGHYRAQAMLFVMEGQWRLAIRIERSDGRVESAVVQLAVPRDNSNRVVQPMYLRPMGATQVEDVAIYPDVVDPDQIDVTNGVPVRLELFNVNAPACGTTVRFAEVGAETTIPANGLGELTFTPKTTGSIYLTCSSTGLDIQTTSPKP